MTDGRGPLDHLIVRVPAVSRSISRGVRRAPPGSALRRRLIQALVKRTFEAMARSDVDAMLLSYEPDAEIEMNGMGAVGLGGRYHGHDGIRAVTADVDGVFAEWRWEVRELADYGDAVAIRADLIAHGRTSGAPITVRDGATAVRLSQRGLVEWQGWYVDENSWRDAREAAAAGSVTDVT